MRDLFNSFLDFKKAFDTVWHAGLWQVFRSVIAEDRLVQAIHEVFGNSSSAVLLKPQLGESLKTAIDLCQGCSLSTILFNLFLETVVQETLYEHHACISIGRRPICNLRFANNIGFMGGSNGELQEFTNRLVDKARAH